jgi:hypothetical protein
MAKSRLSLFQRFMNYVNSDWQWTGGKTDRGYGRIGVGHKTQRANRVSYELFNGPIPEGMEVLHSCDYPGCVDPEHLHLGDDLMNAKERIERNRSNTPQGSKNGNSKLTEDQIVVIRNMYSNGYFQKEIAKMFGVKQNTVSRIVHFRTYKILPK